MKFYLEYPSNPEKRKATRKVPGNHRGTVVCVPDWEPYIDYQGRALVDGIGALQDRPNSVCCGTQISLDYLREKCKRISRQMAFQIHPELKRYLNN